MAEFGSLFIESKGKPIQNNNETVIAVDKIPVPNKFEVSVILISTNSEWQQAVKMKIKGNMISKISGIKSHYIMILEKDLKKAQSFGKKFEYECTSKDNELIVWNAWIDNEGVTQAWVRGAAMKKEIIAPNHFRYYCNDGHIDDDFNEMIFDIIID